MRTSNMASTFSKNLRTLLKKNGKTQADLYKWLNVSSATVSDWCNGKKFPTIDKLIQISYWLNIDLSILLESEYYYPLTQPSEDAQELLSIFARLSDDNKELLLRLGRALEDKG